MNSQRSPAQPLAAVIAAALLLATPAVALAADREGTISHFIDAARRLNPEAQAMALEADAATARGGSAGALDDPKLKAEVMFPRRMPGYWPNRRAEEELYEVRQMFPLWGKRDLKRAIAESDSRKARALQADIENQLAYRVKVAYAEYHAAHLAADETRKLLGTLRRLADLSRARYAQGPGKQQEATGAEAERATLTAELARMEADRHRAQVRLNGLLARVPETPLPAAPQPRPVPPLETLPVEALVERARADYPAVRAAQAQIESADKTRQLVDRSWYPDVELGVGAIRREGRFEAYQAMVEVNIPLYAERRRAEQSEASSMAGAARAKLDQVRLEVATELHEAHALLMALSERKRLLRGTTLPQARIGLEAAMRGYELARDEFAGVLLAEQTLRRAIVEVVNVTFEEQIRLAEIERLIGGDL
ncbi:TolC family protein [Azospirillum soli]|uniref:TolC family protein n=1 Tax=Azospirillum soli TaxID=1304799 RepID=UPI001AE88315|nr:TolC family protein [Azospirillum soli]MBP2311810.1 outer membrane protein TolC [Azospirillum soli]